MTDAALKSKMDTIFETLPPDGKEELEHFLDLLVDKYQVKSPKKIVALGGLWKDTPLNVTNEDIRKLREDVFK